MKSNFPGRRIIKRPELLTTYAACFNDLVLKTLEILSIAVRGSKSIDKIEIEGIS